MQPPSMIMIGPFAYALTVNETEAARGARLDNLVWSYGFIDYAHGRIVLHPDQSPSQMRDTTLHEVLHGIFRLAGIAQDGDGDEKIVRYLSPMLLATLRANPELVLYLMEDEA